MTSFASSATSGWSQGDDDAWGSRANGVADAAPNDKTEATINAPNDTDDVWFYSNMQRQLMIEREAAAAAAPAFGSAATALRHLHRPVSADAAGIVSFDVVPSAVMTGAVGRMRTEANNRSARLQQRLCNPLHPAQEALLRSGGNSMLLTEGPVTPQDAVGRLVSALNICDALQHQQQQQQRQAGQRPTLAGRKSLRPSYNNLHTATSSLAPRAPSERSRRNSSRIAAPSYLADLTRAWVAMEGGEAVAHPGAAPPSSSVGGETGHRAAAVRMPAYRTVSAHTAPLANDSCVMRLRKGKFVPTSAAPTNGSATSTLSVSAPSASPGRSSTEVALEKRLLAEPIRSYRILKDVTAPSVELHSSTHVPLLEAARLRRANLERLNHNFEHQRYVLQGELEDALEWREQCRAAVLQQRSGTANAVNAFAETTTAPGYSSVPSAPPASRADSERVYQGLLDDVFARSPDRRPKTTTTTSALPLSTTAVGFCSVWGKEAARQALHREKERLTQLLNAFEANCEAAALTLADVADLRAETIKRVWHPEEFAESCMAAVFSREHFLAFLQSRYPVNLPVLSSANDARSPTEILDALPSKAEAWFAKYAYQLLPSFPTPA